MKYRIAILCTAAMCLGGCSDNGTTSLQETLTDAVVDPSGAAIDTGYVFNTDYLLLYFGAHWCAPCQAFTPKLVDFYNTEQGGQLFQVLYVSAGHSEREMITYMRKNGMPWPAVVYHSKARKKIIGKYSGSGIPRLVLLNKNGHVIADSFKGKKYLGPQSVLDKLSTKLKSRQTDRAGISKITGKALPTTEKMAKQYIVEGIGEKNNAKMAIINGKVAIVGTELDEGTVVEAITATYVEVSFEGNHYRLKPKP